LLPHQHLKSLYSLNWRCIAEMYVNDLSVRVAGAAAQD